MCKLIVVIENNAMLVLQRGPLPYALPEWTISQPSSYPANHPPIRKNCINAQATYIRMQPMENVSGAFWLRSSLETAERL